MSKFSLNGLFVVVCKIFFTISLVLIPFVIFGSFWLASANQVKSSLNKTDIYSTLSQDISSELTTQLKVKESASLDKIVSQSVKKIITPTIIKQKIEEYIDYNYDWLDNKKSSPVIVPNIDDVRTKLASEISSKTANQIDAKPVCDLSQILFYKEGDFADPFSIPCKMPGVDRQTLESMMFEAVDQEANKNISKISSNLEKSVADKNNSGGFDLLSIVKIVYWWLKHGLMMIISILLVTGTVIIIKFKSNLRWLKMFGKMTISSAVILAIVTALIYASTQTDLSILPSVIGSYKAVISILVRPLVYILVSVLILYIFFGVFAIIAGARRGGGYDRKTDESYDFKENPTSYNGGSGSTFGQSF